MIDVDVIEDALIADIKANISGLKTVETHETDFDNKTAQQLILLNPFILIKYGGLVPVEGERLANQGSGMKLPRFVFSIGAQSLRTRKDAQRGCYSILKELGARYDGGTLVTAQGDVDLALTREQFLFSDGGLVVYGAEYSYFDS